MIKNTRTNQYRIVCLLLLFLLLLFSCTPPVDISADPSETDLTPSVDTSPHKAGDVTPPGKDTGDYWRNLHGEMIAVTDPAQAPREINDRPYFCATVVAIDEYTVTLAPLLDVTDPRDPFPSCAEVLLAHSEQYIAPLAFCGDMTLAVGDTVICSFDLAQVRLTQEYAAPVLCGMSLQAYESLPAERLYFAYWRDLAGNRIALSNQNGASPYFLAEIVETKADYLVVKPRADISLKNAEFVSYSAELLKHSESYIIPRALMMDSHYLTGEDATVGDLVEITFNSLQVYRDTVYGETPVMKIVFYFTPLSEDDITTVP